ncbi:MAG: glucokinase [Thermodesulfobacteriota bacterium]
MSHPNVTDLVLAGDVGGTKTVLGVFAQGEGRPMPQVTATYASAEYPSLAALLDRFLDAHQVTVSAACFGIPGPVVGGRSALTNLPWDVSEASLAAHLGCPRVRLINDLTATALAVPLLRGSELSDLNRGKPDPQGNIGVMAPGTGLGVGLLIRVSGQLRPSASEGGHVDFAPTSEKQVELWRFLREEMPHVSIERLISGPGLENIYKWMRCSREIAEPQWLTDRMRTEDPAKVISETALSRSDSVCVDALDEFVSILGASAGNLALSVMATGGIYLGGGICPKILEKLHEGRFMEAFSDKGRFRELLEKVPVRVVLNDKAALLGAASAACENFSGK